MAPPETRDELLARAAAYARSVPIDVDLDAVDWRISERAKRRAGSCRYDGDRVTISLTWAAYDAHGWHSCVRTIRHELIHAWEFQQFGEAGHGPRFREKAAELDAPRHCEAFSDPRFRLRCRDGCGWTADRHRASKPVKRPREYRCGDCGGRYRVEHAATGETWLSGAGYERAREEIGDEW